MKLLLDENLPHDLRHFLPGHAVFTVAFLGWVGTVNGELLAKAAAEGFDAVLTKDGGIEYEQNQATLPVSVLAIKAKTNKLDDIRPLVPEVLRALAELKPRSFFRVGS